MKRRFYSSSTLINLIVPPPFYFSSQPVRMTRVFMNLLVNRSPTGTCIQLNRSKQRQKRREILKVPPHFKVLTVEIRKRCKFLRIGPKCLLIPGFIFSSTLYFLITHRSWFNLYSQRLNPPEMNGGYQQNLSEFYLNDEPKKISSLNRLQCWLKKVFGPKIASGNEAIAAEYVDWVAPVSEQKIDEQQNSFSNLRSTSMPTIINETLLEMYLKKNPTDKTKKSLLMFALKNQHYVLAETIIARSDQARLNQIDIDGNSAMHYAVRYGNHSILGALLAKKVDVNLKNARGQTPLVAAVAGNMVHSELFEKLVELYSREGLNQADLKGNSALHYAVMRPGKFFIEDLLAKKVDVNLKNVRGQTPLMSAIDRNVINSELFERLIELYSQEALNQADLKGNSALHYAVMKPGKFFIEALLARKVDVNLKNSLGQTPLMSAIDGNVINSELFERLIELYSPEELSQVDVEGNSVLHYAARYSNHSILGVLLAKKVEVNLKNVRGQTPLMVAINEYISNLYMLKVLIMVSSRQALNQVDLKGNSALHYAARYGNHSTFGALLAKKVDVNLKNSLGQTPLMVAAEGNVVDSEIFEKLIESYAPEELSQVDLEGDPERQDIMMKENKLSIEALLAKKVDVNLKKSLGQTPLMMAIHEDSRNLDILEMLLTLSSREELNQVDWKGNSALHYAVMATNKWFIEALLAKKVDVSLKNGLGQTPLMMAIDRNIDLKRLEPLLGAYSQKALNRADREGNSALHYAVMKTNKSFIEALLAKKVDVSLKNGLGQTPLMMAIDRNIDLKSLEPLLEAYFQEALNQVDWKRNSALHYAVMQRNKSSIEALLAKKADGNLKNGLGQTPLIMAIDRNIDLKILESLLEAYSQEALNQVDGEGNSALHYAVMQRDKSFIAALLARKADGNLKNALGQTPLMMVIDENSSDLELFNLLIKAYSQDKRNQIDAAGNTIVHYLVGKTQPRVSLLKVFTENKVSFNRRNCNGESALGLLVKKWILFKHPSDFEAIKFLINQDHSSLAHLTNEQLFSIAPDAVPKDKHKSLIRLKQKKDGTLSY